MSLDAISRSVDPITFEILSHKLHQITEEMGATLERVGGTVNTTQMHDYMASLYRADGEILSAGESMGQHVACAGFAVKRIIEKFEKDGDIHPGDLFLLNDPYVAAIHQSDVYMIAPIHYEGRLIAWSATFVHVTDIGAMSPRGFSPGATEICHEGVRIPGIKLIERGKLRKDVFDTITNMTRQPVMVGLDLKCEIAANNVATSKLQAMYRQYGPELVDAVSLEMIRYTETILRKRIGELPDGTWKDAVTMQTDERLTIAVTLHKREDRLIFDFTGTGPQARRGINLPYHGTFGVCYKEVISALGHDIPKNHGAFRPIELVAPEGTVVNVRYPGPVSLNTTSGMNMVQFLVISVLNQMFSTSEKWKTEVIAPNLGSRGITHSGVNQHGRYYVSNLPDVGGGGARSLADGINSGGGQLSCPNVEWAELNFPLLYLFRRHIKDGAGAGRFRGGTGVESAVTIHDARDGKLRGVAMGVAGLRNSGQGVFGGYPGAPSVLKLFEATRVPDLIAQNQSLENLEELGGKARLLPYCEFDLNQGDVLYRRNASGGGYGDPLEREPDLVLSDVIDGLLSREAARDVYGVALDEQTWELDLHATRALRSGRREESLKHPGSSL